MNVIFEMYDHIRQLISRKNPPTAYVLDPKCKSAQLLEGICAGKYTSDEAAAQDLFPDSEDSEKCMQNYRKIKYQLLNKLIRLHYFLNLRSDTHSEYMVNAFTAKKELVVAEMLQWFQRHEAMKQVVFRVLRKARRYHLTPEKLRCYEILRNYYSKFGPQKECTYYTKLISETLAIYNAEIVSSNLRTQLRSELSRHTTLDPDHFKEFIEPCQKLAKNTEVYQTRTLWLNYSVTVGLLSRLGGDYVQAKRIYESYLGFFQKNPHLCKKENIAQICYYSLRCCLFMRDYESAYNYVEQGDAHQDLGTYNWFCHKSAHFLLCLHTQNWQTARDVFAWVVNHPNFRNDAIRVEIWSVYEGFLQFFLPESIALPTSETVHGATFQLHRLLQEIDQTRQDKSGMNIAILIFQALHYLKQRNFDLLDSRIDAIQQYAYKWLRNDTDSRFVRTDCLFKSLSAMRDCQYEVQRTQERVATLLKRMESVRSSDGSEKGMAPIEEIAPYEHDWQSVIRELERIETEQAIIRPYNPTIQTKETPIAEDDVL